MNVEPTAEVIDEMVNTLAYYGKSLERIAARMREAGDIELAREATSAITNCIQNLRLDLLVARPIREFQRDR